MLHEEAKRCVSYFLLPLASHADGDSRGLLCEEAHQLHCKKCLPISSDGTISYQSPLERGELSENGEMEGKGIEK